jgi:hypothetical protein
VTCAAFAARYPDQFGRLPAAPPRLLHIVQQPGQQDAVDDLDPGRTTRTRDQPGPTPVKLSAVFAVLGVDRLIDDPLRELEL